MILRGQAPDRIQVDEVMLLFGMNTIVIFFTLIYGLAEYLRYTLLCPRHCGFACRTFTSIRRTGTPQRKTCSCLNARRVCLHPNSIDLAPSSASLDHFRSTTTKTHRAHPEVPYSSAFSQLN